MENLELRFKTTSTWWREATWHKLRILQLVTATVRAVRHVRSKALPIVAWTAFPLFHTNAMLHVLAGGRRPWDGGWVDGNKSDCGTCWEIQGQCCRKIWRISSNQICFPDWFSTVGIGYPWLCSVSNADDGWLIGWHHGTLHQQCHSADQLLTYHSFGNNFAAGSWPPAAAWSPTTALLKHNIQRKENEKRITCFSLPQVSCFLYEMLEIIQYQLTAALQDLPLPRMRCLWSVGRIVAKNSRSHSPRMGSWLLVKHRYQTLCLLQLIINHPPQLLYGCVDFFLTVRIQQVCL